MGRPWWGLALVGIVTGMLPQPWRPIQPTNVRQPGAFRGPPLTESSGAVTSRLHPGRFWSMNDSGNPASLFLVDTTAKIHGFVRVAGVLDTDWEALAAGPCGSSWCLYIGDIGDNASIRQAVTIFRVVEPGTTQLLAASAKPCDSLVVRYPDGPRDAESMVVTKAGDIAIITKGRDGRVAIYWIPSSSWGQRRAVARLIGTLPIPTSTWLGHLVTDAALALDEQTLAVRTYRDIYLFRRTPASRWLPDQPSGVCSIAGLDLVGEGLAWWNARTLLMTSETTRFGPGQITLLECRPR